MNFQKTFVRIALGSVLIAVAFFLTHSLVVAQQPAAQQRMVEYKVVRGLGQVTPQNSALDSFTKAKPMPTLESQLKDLGRDGWMLFRYDREDGFAIFYRQQ